MEFAFSSKPQIGGSLEEHLARVTPEQLEVVDDDYQRLDRELGESIDGLLSSLTTTMLMNPDAKIDDLRVEFTSDEAASQDTSGMMVIPSNILKTTGLDGEKLAGWQERLDDSKEDKPLLFELIDDSVTLRGEPLKVVRVEFTGTDYTVTRASQLLMIETRNGVVEAVELEHARVWDYNAEKRRQRRAESAQMSAHVLGEVMELEAGDTEAVAERLVALGSLLDPNFDFNARYGSRDEDDNMPDLSKAEILAYHGNIRTMQERYPQPDGDIDVTGMVEELHDPLQQALVNFELQLRLGEHIRKLDSGQISGIDSHALQKDIEETIAATQGALVWGEEALRRYMVGVVERTEEQHKAEFESYYNGPQYNHAAMSHSVRAWTEYPELSGGSRECSLELAIALAENPPPIALLEVLRAQYRLQEDIEKAEAQGEYDRADALEAELDTSVASLEEREDFAVYLTTLNEASAAAFEKHAPLLRKHSDVSSQAMVAAGTHLTQALDLRVQAAA